MMRALEHYVGLAREMEAADAERDRMLRAMDDMWQNRWSLLDSVAGLQWIHKVVSTDPHDAIRAGTRVLSSVAPRVSVQPLGPSAETRGRADQLERALSWHFRNASRRRRASVLRDVVLSALLYDEVVAQVVYLPHQIEAVESFEGETRRLEAARRFGPFAVIVRNPQQVHVRYSDWMPEAVVMKKVMPTAEAIDFWGKKARKLKSMVRKSEEELGFCTVFDYMDVEERVVWAVAGDSPRGQSLGEADAATVVEILREEHGLGFLPWAAKVGGTTLEDDAGRQRTPLLHSIYQTGQWDTQNIVETLLASEAIAYAAAPRLKVEGPSDNVEVDYGEPGRTAYVPPGHALSAMAPPALDQGLAVIAQRVAERIGKSTVPRILQTGDFPSGTAFATLNLATQSGIKALTPYKELAEEALAEIFTQMLNWVRVSGEPLRGYEPGPGHAGEQFVIDPKKVDIENLYVDVELTADVPTDRMARINAASMAVRELGYSRQRALEQIGETDAQFVMSQAEEEALAEVELEIEKQRKLALGQLETEQMLAEAREKLNKPKDEPEAKKDNGLESPNLLKRIEERVKALGAGQGFNPALGGTPPVMADPEGVAGKASEKDEKGGEEA